MREISFTNCTEALLAAKGKYRAHTALVDWRNRPGYDEVVKFVEGFTHRHLFQISSSDVRETILRSGHALGDVRAGEQLRFIEDFTTPFAFQHLFHWYVEEKKSIPTWKEFRDWMVIDAAAPLWYIPLKEYVKKNHSGISSEALSRAARWRLGKVYISNIRELELLGQLRDLGLPINYHLIADVLFRVDFWSENLLICTYFPNEQYRNGERLGRKPPAEQFFEGSFPPYKVIHVPIARQGFGKIWLAASDSVKALADQIRGIGS